MLRGLLSILALVLAATWSPAARAADATPPHLREVAEFKALATAVVQAMEKHEFDAAATTLERARAHARALGESGHPALLELDAVESLLAIERRAERGGAQAATATFAAIARDFGEPVALRSAAALPFVQTFLLQANFADGLALLETVEREWRTGRVPPGPMGTSPPPSGPATACARNSSCCRAARPGWARRVPVTGCLACPMH